jgi:5-hydroxyisourate hydrolase
MSWLSTHILNTATGKPAADVTVVCEAQRNNGFKELSRGTTNADGRLNTFFPAGHSCVPGLYRLTFETAEYFARQNQPTLYPRVQIIFEVKTDEEHYHIPLLIAPFGYSTYRGT